jgi:D-arabinose 1-dehydrogenase-like Zn-dependent alcohol dehydrogenase
VGKLQKKDQMMKAAVINAPNTEVRIQERDRPSPGRGEVLIRVHACGVCHGDLMLQLGQFPFALYPIVPGHEIAGVIEEVGEDVGKLQPGDRVGLSALFSSCGCCEQCLASDEFLCSEMQFTGITRDGGYSQFMLAPAAYVAPLPDYLDFAEAAPLMCAGLTVFSGLRHAGFEPGDKVAVIGLGGLGHMGVLFARAMGGRVAVLSTSADKEDEARELGAEHFIDLKTQSPSEALRSWEGGADIILATPPAAEPMIAAFPGLALNGTMVVLGAPPDNIAVSPMELIMGRRRLMGSPAGSRKDLHDILHLAATHSVRPRVTRLPLEEAGKALKQMHEGTVRGRAVLVMD